MTKTEILEEVVKRTARNEITNIDYELTYILKEITFRYPFLKSKATIHLTEGSSSYLFGDDNYSDILVMIDDENSVLNRVKNWIDFYELDESKTKSVGRPTDYYVSKQLNNNVVKLEIVFYPVPNDDYDFTCHYSLLHPSTLTTILLPDNFLECVINGVCYKVFIGKGLPTQAQPFNIEYEKQLNILMREDIDKDVYQVKYRDV